MKELSIEQKAKAYDEIIKKANKMHSENCEVCQMCIEELIPEFREESEDEKIRKELIDYINSEYRHTLGLNRKNRFIVWLEKQGEQKPAWSKEDKDYYDTIIAKLEVTQDDALLTDNQMEFLKSLKNRVQLQSKQEWKQENIEELSDFENVMMHIGDSFFGKNSGLDPNDTNTIKEQAAILLGLVPKQEWNKEDEERLKNIISVLDVQVCWDGATGKKGNPYQKEINWLKSLRPQLQWKPNQTILDSLEIIINHPDRMTDYNKNNLIRLLEQLKKLKG